MYVVWYHVKLLQNARIRSAGRECIQIVGNISQIPRPLNVNTRPSIDGKPFPAFLLYSIFLGKIFKFN